jgi:hypothetical protein
MNSVAYFKKSFGFLSSKIKRSKRSSMTAESLLAYIQFNENPINNREKRLHPFIAEALQLVMESNAELQKPISVFEKNLEVSELGLLFDKFGSDKNGRHSYGQIYERIIRSKDSLAIIEIGLGSNNGFPYGGLNPGGSIKAWREYRPESFIVGVDIDPEAVASIAEVGVVMDQTSESSIKSAYKEISRSDRKFDLIIDDGFHDPHANVRTLLTFFNLLAPDGVYIIEDVHGSLIPFWCVLSNYLPGKFELYDLRKMRVGIDDNVLIVIRKTTES